MLVTCGSITMSRGCGLQLQVYIWGLIKASPTITKASPALLEEECYADSMESV
jgi:hypothetical protein